MHALVINVLWKGAEIQQKNYKNGLAFKIWTFSPADVIILKKDGVFSP